MMRDDFAFDVLFWGTYGFVLFTLGWWIRHKMTASAFAELRWALEQSGEALHKTNTMNAQETHELRGKIKRLTEELESTRKLNVEIARDKEQMDEQIRNQIFTIEAFQKRDTLIDKASRDMASKAIQLEENIKTQTLTISNLQLAYDRCQDVFKDLSIHLNDMALKIDSVAPNAKGD